MAFCGKKTLIKGMLIMFYSPEIMPKIY